jgi:hypothetical protein
LAKLFGGLWADGEHQRAVSQAYGGAGIIRVEELPGLNGSENGRFSLHADISLPAHQRGGSQHQEMIRSYVRVDFARRVVLSNSV